MRRSITLLIVFVCFTAMICAAQAASPFQPYDAQSARLAALDCLVYSAFEAEYNSGTGGRMFIWTTPLQIYVGGHPTQSDLNTLNAFLIQLAVRVPGLPNARIVSNERDANITLYFVQLNQMNQYVDFYVQGNWGYCSFRTMSDVCVSAKIAIATDKTTQSSRNHLIQEELFCALGLCNDHDLYSDSIIYGQWTETQAPCDVDWLMLNMLYSPHVSPGMTYDEVRAIFLPLIAQ